MAFPDALAYSNFLTSDTTATWAPITYAGVIQGQTDAIRANTAWLENYSGLSYGALGATMPSIPTYDIAQFTFKQMNEQWNNQGANFGMFNWGNFNGFTFNPSGSSSSSSSSGSGKTELETTRDFLNKILELSKDSKSGVKIKRELKSKIDEALKTKGSDDDKLEAMQEVVNKIPDGIKTKVLYAMNSEELSSIGIDRKSEDKDIKNAVLALHNVYADNLTPDKCTNTALENLADQISRQGSTKILTAISHWNTQYNSSDCILGDIVKKLKVSDFTEEDKKEALLNIQIKPLVNVMLSAAQEEIENLKNDGYDVSDLESKREALNNANNALSKTAFNTANFNSLVDAFKNMYAALRINLANKMDKDIQDQYGFLNTAKKTNFKENMILEKTKEDLTAEGITASGINPGERTEDPDEDLDEDEFSDGTDIESDLEILTSTEGGKTPSLVKKTAGSETYYETKEGSAGAKRYYYKDGNTIKEIKNAKSVAASGEITFQDGTKKSLADYKSSHHSDKEVKPEVIKETNKSLKKLATLITEGRLEEHPTYGKGKVFCSVNNKVTSDKQFHYYTINDEGKLCEIRYKDNHDNEISNFTGDKFKVKDGSSTVEKDYPADFDLVEVSDSDIRSKVKKADEVAPTTLQELKDLGGTSVSGTKNGCAINCWKCNGKYYLEGPNGSLKEVTGFTETGAAPTGGSGSSGGFKWN